MRFYLGTHHPDWLGRLLVPLFVSLRRLMRQKSQPHARTGWALDSGGFTELHLHGRWMLSPQEYARAVWALSTEITKLQWASPQDWMCEASALAATGLTIKEHQIRTVDNFMELRALRSPVHFIPVLQGWTPADYMACVEMYEAHGLRLADEPLVGLGTVCRRQATSEIAQLISSLNKLGLKLHGFGVKKQGLQLVGSLLKSADSMAWSSGARREARPMFPECEGKHINCANCVRYALRWRRELLSGLGDAKQTCAG